MIADRYYYNRLSAEEKEIYNQLYKGILNLEKEIKMPGWVPSKEAVHRVFSAMTDDNPHLYYFNQTQMAYSCSPFGSTFMPNYYCTAEQIATYNGRIQECVNKIVTSLDLQNCSELEKVKRVHDYMALNIVYDYEALDTKSTNRLVAAHSIIGVFAKQRAVCEGIAKATKILLNTANVGCIVASGIASLNKRGPHAWNIVKIDGKAYHLDVTWDVANTKNGLVNYDYFNLTDEAISADHFDFVGLPKCDSWDANYFYSNRLCFADLSSLERAILKGLVHGVSSFYFQMMPEGHSMTDLVVSARNFVTAELSKNGEQAKVHGSCNEERRTGRITIERV